MMFINDWCEQVHIFWAHLIQHLMHLLGNWWFNYAGNIWKYKTQKLADEDNCLFRSFHQFGLLTSCMGKCKCWCFGTCYSYPFNLPATGAPLRIQESWGSPSFLSHYIWTYMCHWYIFIVDYLFNFWFNPQEQKFLIGVILMVPCYAVESVSSFITTILYYTNLERNFYGLPNSYVRRKPYWISIRFSVKKFKYWLVFHTSSVYVYNVVRLTTG